MMFKIGQVFDLPRFLPR